MPDTTEIQITGFITRYRDRHTEEALSISEIREAFPSSVIPDVLGPEDCDFFEVDPIYQQAYPEPRKGFKVVEGEIILINDKWVKTWNEVPFTPEEAIQVAKMTRTEIVENILVEMPDGMIFQGDEDSRNRLTSAVVGLDPEESTMWITQDNIPVIRTREYLRQLLRKICLAQSEVWNIYGDVVV